MKEKKIHFSHEPDRLLVDIADYVTGGTGLSEEAYDTSRLCLADSLGCAIHALDFPACAKLLGPVVPGTVVPLGARVPGTEHVLDPVRAAFNLGAMIRWLDFNDTWLAAEWGHPSDNIGGILAVADYLGRTRDSAGETPLKIRNVLTAVIKAYEIQGILALENSFNRVGLDHVILVKAATAAATAGLMGATRDQVVDVLSHVFIDNGPLRTYRHAPNTGSRKSWAAGDATSRGVMLALAVLSGEMGYPTALSAETWGFQDVVMKGKPIVINRPLGSYVMENILFKVSFPAEFHAQTAVECAIQLHPWVKERIDDIKEILIETQESAVRIIDKTGPLHNPADRDHCIQYMTACALLYGELTAGHYEDEAAKDPRIDMVRSKMKVQEKKSYSRDYIDPEKRSIANAVTITLKDGTRSERVEVEYPTGHRRKRAESIPLLFKKLEKNISARFSKQRIDRILVICSDRGRLESMEVPAFMELFVND